MIRPLAASDFGWVLALSAENEVETSFLDASRLDAMVRASFCAPVIEGEAYLIAFAPGAQYDSENYRWFEFRESDFVYVDRVVVATAKRGNGLARALYEHLFALARAAGIGAIACEVNSDPPNPGSDAFHARLGFTEVGRALLGNGKSVRYLKRLL